MRRLSLKTAGEIIVVALYTFLFFKSFSHDPHVNLYLARFYINQKQDCATAIKLLRGEITAYPDDADIHSTLAQCYFMLGENEKAVPHLRKVLSLQPDNKDILRILKYNHHGEKK